MGKDGEKQGKKLMKISTLKGEQESTRYLRRKTL